MDVCDLNKFLDISDEMDCYRFDPINKVVIISISDKSVTIDLNMDESEQILKFQDWLDILEIANGD